MQTVQGSAEDPKKLQSSECCGQEQNLDQCEQIEQRAVALLQSSHRHEETLL